ncbi:MAG: InlB B-repeat-containing protein, partial [Muribaculaceae bacterium]|nr:InlB B-repeat-containing protein [Muribaculaceae bacterium]
MSAFLALFAAVRSDAWTVNPSEYRYDMSLYFTLSSKEYTDLDKYEIGAFIGDECRGLAEKVELPDEADCMLLRIRSNSTAEGQEVVFKMLNRETDEVMILKGRDGEDFTFKADQTVGLPSAPYILTPYYNVTVKAGAHGTVDFENGMYAEGTVLHLDAVADEGYHFDSWSDGSTEAQRSLIVNGNIELTASFSVSSYTLTFILDGETVTTMTLEYGATVTAPSVPEKEGYTFSGWQDLPSKMPAHDVEVIGSYSINSYNAVFKIDGSVIATLIFEYGAEVIAPEAPEKEGYTFDGWQDVPETVPAHDVEILGTYTVNSYTATFYIESDVIATLSVDYGTVIPSPEAPVREGYTFDGWLDVPETMPAHDIEIEGSYTINSYKATFILDGEIFETVNIDYGTPVKGPRVPDKEGYVFSGWQNIPETMPAHDIEVIGTYDVKKYTALFKIDGEVFETLNLAYGEAIKAPVAPEKEGYTFGGWQNLPATMPARDIEVTGSYTINSYKAVFMLDGDVFETLNVEYGAVVNAPEAPEKEGYTFGGWNDVPETMPAHDIEITGSYSVNSYNIVFKVEGNVLETLSVEYGAAIEAPAAPAKEGYTFSEWAGLPAVMPAHDIETEAVYTINSYKAVFMLDGDVFETLNVEYG